MYTFARYCVGEVFGPYEITVGPELLQQWDATFPDLPAEDDGNTIPAGLLSVLTMRAYGHLIAPRPPGNIHAGLGFDINRLPSRGEVVAMRFECVGKTAKRERQFVELGFEGSDADGTVLFRGRFMSIVAQ